MNDLFQQSDQDRDYLADLVGEGKKFKDTQALARGKAESDNFIQTLQNQLDELRTDYLRLDAESKSRATIEELIRNQHVPEQTDITPTPTAPPSNAHLTMSKPKPEVNLDDLIDTRLSQHEQRRREEANVSRTQELLRERFGTEYVTKLRETISQIGLDEAYVNSLARKSPDAVYRLLGLEQTAEPFQAPPRRTSLSSLQRAEPKRTWSYYQAMRKSNPSEYHSAKTNVQMHQDAQQLGEAFFDTD